MLFRTEVLKKLGYIPESYFLFYEETEWCYKAKEQGFKNICLTDYYIYHKGSVSINAINGLQEYLMNRNKSKSGSADVLEALGINVAASPETLSKALDEVGLAFIFAQTMHPAMRFIGPARQALGIPTIMNLVGPLANPLDLETQLMGLYRVELQEIVANAIQQLGRKRAVIITGPDNMDEAALYGTNTYTLLEDGHISQHTFTYEDLGMEKVELSDITGGDAKENAEILLSVLKNEATPYLETTVLNAGLGFFANGKVATIKEGVELARQLIADGSALEKLRQLQEVQV